MARTISEIFDALVAEKQTLATLSPLVEDSSSNSITPYRRMLADINSASKVSPWRLWLFIVSVAIWIHESNWDIFKTEITVLVDQAISGNVPWYKRQVQRFQYGYNLELIKYSFQYSAIDESAQIIQRVAIVEGDDGKLRIKVAKLDSSDLPIQLEVSEINAFTAYINKIKFAGTKLLIINDPADELRYDLAVYFNPLITVDTVIANTEAAINSYLTNLDFNGAINITKFVDAIQEATGINDIVINSLQSRYGVIDFFDVIRQCIPNSGYFKVVGGTHLGTVVNNSDGSVNTSNSQNVSITYIPNV